jgi:hypothetical protein
VVDTLPIPTNDYRHKRRKYLKRKHVARRAIRIRRSTIEKVLIDRDVENDGGIFFSQVLEETVTTSHPMANAFLMNVPTKQKASSLAVVLSWPGLLKR